MKIFNISSKTPIIIGITAFFACCMVFGAVKIFPNYVNETTGVTHPVSHVGSPAASAYVLDADREMYVIDYSSVDWTGNIHSRTLSASGELSSIDSWEGGASAKINSQNYNTRRNIVTMHTSGIGVSFRWPSLSTAQKQSLDSDTSIGASSSVLLNYIRGDRSNEAPNGTKLRKRAGVLGDIIHSTPLHWDDGTDQTVFVGANDGMLHAINAQSGEERFAYVPSQLLPYLSKLSASPYMHRYYVDGQLAAHKYSNMSVLVGGLGGGGKGFFGLNITSAPVSETDAATKVLWEISSDSSDFANLGNTYGTPILTMLPDGTPALIVGNGYNNTGNGHSSLFIINPQTGAKIVEIDAGTGTIDSPNGMSSPSIVDTDQDGKADYAYAGDLDGSMWKFDLSSKTASLLHKTSPAQSISTAPSFVIHPLGGRIITFATGKIFTESDESDSATHYAYGIWDRPSAYSSNSVLLSQSLKEDTYVSGSTTARVRTVSNNQPDWRAGPENNYGWKTALYTDSPTISGERVVGDGAFVTGGVFMFMTTNPTIKKSEIAPGENWWMQLNALTGGYIGTPRLDLNTDGIFSYLDQTSNVYPVGFYLGGGVRSQLTAFTGSDYEVYFSNYDANGDPPIYTTGSLTTEVEYGVAGGHFDVDVFDGNDCCNSETHRHQYDDPYDVTGVNMLDPNLTDLNLSKFVSQSQQFKVIVSNQYLSPAVKLHLGDSQYVYTKDVGYIFVKDYLTSNTFNLSSLQVYTLGASFGNVKNIGSLAVNVPFNGMSSKDWWGNGDVRAGLHPTETKCVKESNSKTDGNMFNPVIPPPAGVNGPGENGWSNSSTPTTSSGVRHNGALTIQIIDSTTPDSSVELSVATKPEFGRRVKSVDFSKYVLAEYTIFWHHENKLCYGDAGWTKNPDIEHSAVNVKALQALHTDPKIGSFGNPAEGTTTTTFINGDGSLTTTVITTEYLDDGTYKTTTTVTRSGGTNSDNQSDKSSISVGGVVDSNGDISGDIRTTAPTVALGRQNWRQLLK